MAFTFTYNSYTPSQLLGRYSLTWQDGRQTLEQDFLVTIDPDSNDVDGDLKTAVQAARDALYVANQDFVLKYGSDTVLDWTQSTRKSFAARPSVSKVGGPMDGNRSQRLRFRLEVETEPREASRAGRRSATVDVRVNPDGLRTVTFRGTYTSTSASPTAAIAQYEAQVATWIATDWTGAGKPLEAATGATWWPLEQTVQVDDTNNTAQFTYRYAEIAFSSEPSNTDDGVIVSGSFTRLDLPESGVALALGGLLPGGGEDDVLDPYRTSETPAGGGVGGAQVGVGAGTPVQATRRYQVSASSWVEFASGTTVNDWWADVLRPWIVATVNAMFGHTARVVFERLGPAMDDAGKRGVQATCTLRVIAESDVLSYTEDVTVREDERINVENVYSGTPHHYDLTTPGPQTIVTQTVSVTRADTWPNAPAELFPPWVRMERSQTLSAKVLDPVTGAVTAYQSRWSLRYLWAGGSSGAGPLVGAPLGGSSGGSGGTVVTPGGSGDLDGTEELQDG